MRRELIMPTLIILLMIGSAIGYLSVGDYRKFGYWLAGAILNICITF
jgi:hypothetical protein